MLRRVKQYMALLTDPPKKAVLLECGHTAQITDGKIYLKGYWFDCPHCGEEWKRGEEEKPEADGCRGI